MEQAAQHSVPVSVTNQSARLSMWLGIVSVFGGVIITSIPAIVFGHLALRQIRASKGKQHGKGMASAGLILGYIITIASLILIGCFAYNISMVLGIVSVFGITSISAIVFGHVALRQIRASKGKQHGKAIARLVLILGYIITIAFLILIGWFVYDLWWWTFRSGI